MNLYDLMEKSEPLDIRFFKEDFAAKMTQNQKDMKRPQTQNAVVYSLGEGYQFQLILGPFMKEGKLHGRNIMRLKYYGFGSCDFQISIFNHKHNQIGQVGPSLDDVRRVRDSDLKCTLTSEEK